MPHYKVRWSEYQSPWILETPERLGEFVRGLLTDADERLPVGARITIDVILSTGEPVEEKK